MNNRQKTEKYQDKVNQDVRQILASVKAIMLPALIVAVLILLITKVFIINAIIPSASMEPALPVGSYAFCARTSYWFSLPNRGDIVVIEREIDNSTVLFTKRVVGLPGEMVEIRGGVTYIDNQILAEEYLADTPEKHDLGPLIIPEGGYFCMGDNRNDSFDSRYWDGHFVFENEIKAQVHWFFAGYDNFGIV